MSVFVFVDIYILDEFYCMVLWWLLFFDMFIIEFLCMVFIKMRFFDFFNLWLFEVVISKLFRSNLLLKF